MLTTEDLDLDNLFSTLHVPYAIHDPTCFNDTRWLCAGHGHKNDASCAFACGWFQWMAGMDGTEPPNLISDGPVSEAFRLVREFFEGDAKLAVEWFVAKNPQFGGLSACDLIAIGREDKLLRWVTQALAENPPRYELPDPDPPEVVEAMKEAKRILGIIDEANAAADAADEIVAQVAAESTEVTIEVAKAELKERINELSAFHTAWNDTFQKEPEE